MDRFVFGKSFSWAAACLSLAVVSAASLGCKGPLTTVAYLVHGHNVPADYDGLKHQRVVVAVRPPPGGSSADPEYGARELAQKVGEHLQRNVRGIKVVDQQEVERWKDDLNTADKDDFRALGAALKADRVVAVEMEEFRLNDNSTSLYTGRCDYRVIVYDLADKEGVVAWEHSPNEAFVYPPNHGIPIGDKSRPGFRKIFAAALAEGIAEHFYAHDSTTHFARDSESLEYH